MVSPEARARAERAIAETKLRHEIEKRLVVLLDRAQDRRVPYRRFATELRLLADDTEAADIELMHTFEAVTR